jgi:hypothetical protein
MHTPLRNCLGCYLVIFGRVPMPPSSRCVGMTVPVVVVPIGAVVAGVGFEEEARGAEGAGGYGGADGAGGGTAGFFNRAFKIELGVARWARVAVTWHHASSNNEAGDALHIGQRPKMARWFRCGSKP